MVFDARAAKALQPGDAMAVPGCPGLRLLATKNLKTWTYRYKAPDGKLRQVAIGPWPALTLHDAMAKWMELRGQKSAGVDPVAQRKALRAAAKATPAASKSYTVAMLVADYVKGHLLVSRKAAGAEAARKALDRLIEQEPELAAADANLVTRAQCFDVLEARKATPMATAKLRSMLGSAWEYALDAGRLDGNTPNWWRQVMKGRLKSKGKVMAGKHVGQRRRALRDDEVRALLAWLGNMHQVGQDAVVMYLWTCTRGSEIFGLRPEQLAVEVRGEDAVLWWTIPKEQTKNARYADAVDLRVPLWGRARQVVERRLASVGQSGYLFEDSRGKPYTQHAFSTYVYDLQPYSPKAKRRDNPALQLPVTDWTPHNLRRTGRTMLAALGCPAEIAEAIVGHMPEEIEATYNVHTYDQERLVWLRRLSDHLESLASSGAPARP